MKYWHVTRVIRSHSGQCDIHTTVFCATEAIAKRIVEEPCVRVTMEERETKGYLAINQSDPYTHHHGFEQLGMVCDCRGAYSHTALAIPNDEHARRAFVKAQKDSVAAQDSYYSRPWV